MPKLFPFLPFNHSLFPPSVLILRIIYLLVVRLTCQIQLYKMTRCFILPGKFQLMMPCNRWRKVLKYISIVAILKSSNCYVCFPSRTNGSLQSNSSYLHFSETFLEHGTGLGEGCIFLSFPM